MSHPNSGGVPKESSRALRRSELSGEHSSVAGSTASGTDTRRPVSAWTNGTETGAPISSPWEECATRSLLRSAWLGSEGMGVTETWTI